MLVEVLLALQLMLLLWPLGCWLAVGSYVDVATFQVHELAAVAGKLGLGADADNVVVVVAGVAVG